MSKFFNFAAATVAATLVAGAASAVTVTTPFLDSESLTYSGADTLTQTYELDFSTSFDVSFSSTTISADAGNFSYTIVDAADSSVIASGTLPTVFDSGSTVFEGATESFYYASDFIVTLYGDVTSGTGGWTIVSPSEILPAVPLPAGVFLLGGALGALGIARRKA